MSYCAFPSMSNSLALCVCLFHSMQSIDHIFVSVVCRCLHRLSGWHWKCFSPLWWPTFSLSSQPFGFVSIHSSFPLASHSLSFVLSGVCDWNSKVNHHYPITSTATAANNSYSFSLILGTKPPRMLGSTKYNLIDNVIFVWKGREHDITVIDEHNLTHTHCLSSCPYVPTTP